MLRTAIPYSATAGCALETVAENACEGQIVLDRLSAMLLADDVLDLAAEKGVVFVDKAVLANALGAFLNKPTEGAGT